VGVKQNSIGLVGCGKWGALILRDLNALGCAVHVVARSEESRERARAGGARSVVDSIASLPPVDGAVVATTTISHGEVIEELIYRDVPIYVEKPITADIESAQRIAARAPDRVFVMDKWRYHPGVGVLAEIARSGELGPVLGLRTTRVQWGNSHGDVDGVWILAPHDLSIALEILGYLPEPRMAVGELIDGSAQGLIAVLGTDPYVVFEVSGRHQQWRREVRLHCRDGIAVLSDGYSPHVEIAKPSSGDFRSPQIEARPISGAMPLYLELEAFVEHIGGGPPPKSSAAEGAAMVALLAELRQMAGLDRLPTGRPR